MLDFHAALARRYWGTKLENWLIAAAIALSVAVVLNVLRRFALGRARRWAARTPSRVDDVLVSLLSSLRSLFFFAVGLWVASEYVVLSAKIERGLRTTLTLLTLVQIGLSLQAGLRTFAQRFAGGDADNESKTVASATAFLISLSMWAILTVTGLSVLGFEISALVAGLGVGGVAAALAVQNILGDLFASLSIYFDRPFNLGDFIKVGDDLGTVEKIGLRTTRVRSLSGEQIVFANGDLTKSRVRNFKRMSERRVQFGFGVKYDTPPDRLREIPILLKRLVETRERTRFERAHFKECGAFSLNFEVVYFVLSPDYNLYMDYQQTINLALLEGFAERGIEFAFPGQELVLVSTKQADLRKAPEPEIGPRALPDRDPD